MKLSGTRFFRDEVQLKIDTGNIKTFERFTYATSGKRGKIYDVVLREPALKTKIYFVNHKRVEKPELIHLEIESHFKI